MYIFSYKKWFQKPLHVSSLLFTVPFLYFYKDKLYDFFYFLTNRKRIKTENILTKSDDYIENKKEQFLETLKKGALNENIEKEFYNETIYKDAIVAEDNKLEKSWKKRILFEQTPRGSVIMYYDAFKMAFSYYSDTNSLPYKLLNAIAMKYCLTFHCMDFFIDQNIVSIENESPLIKIHHIEKKKKSEKKNIQKEDSDENSPFAKLKNYNNDKLKTKDNNDQTKENKDEKIKNIITNKFVSLGKIRSFQPLYKPLKKNKSVQFTSSLLENLEQETNLQKQVMSYKDFKNKSLHSE
tara:strand:- start:1546 stop:2430 length:885 start_codon:yes stop_codon:yes gene_type:complete